MRLIRLPDTQGFSVREGYTVDRLFSKLKNYLLPKEVSGGVRGAVDGPLLVAEILLSYGERRMSYRVSCVELQDILRGQAVDVCRTVLEPPLVEIIRQVGISAVSG